MSRKVMLLGLLLLTLSGIIPARADGLMFVEGVYRQPAISHVDVLIKQKVATTTLEQTFRNPLNKQVTATYVAPVPPGATLSGFAEKIDDQWIDAKIENSDKAKSDFNKAAGDGKDAALASASVQTPPGLDPKTTFITQIVLPANGERSVRLTYTEVLTGQTGLTRYTYPLSSTKLTDERVGDLSVSVRVEENSEIRAVYSPSHAIEVTRPSNTESVALYRAQNVSPAQDFEMVYTLSSDKIGLNLVSYRNPDEEDGYYVLIAAPQLNVNADEIVQKDFVFVLDRSGSMQGQKFEQAKTALRKMIDGLNPGDRFNIIAFDNNVTPWTSGLQSLDMRSAAKDWVTALPLGGGTNINDALIAAFRTVDSSSQRPHIIVFLTDGQPTAGETAITKILANSREAMQKQSRLYTIGVGDDVNKPLLDSLASENRGNTLYVTNFDQIETQLGKFYAGIGTPVLVDLSVDYGDMQVYDSFPNPIPDMFLGGQVVVAGRYKDGGTGKITLNGKINGQPYSTTFDNISFVSPKDEAPKTDYVARLWAQRKVDALVRKLEVYGPDQDAMDAVKALGLKYNIVTPYTSFVVAAPTSASGSSPVVPIPGTGLPFLYTDDYRSFNTTLLIVGSLFTLLGCSGFVLSRVRANH